MTTTNTNNPTQKHGSHGFNQPMMSLQEVNPNTLNNRHPTFVTPTCRHGTETSDMRTFRTLMYLSPQVTSNGPMQSTRPPESHILANTPLSDRIGSSHPLRKSNILFSHRTGFSLPLRKRDTLLTSLHPGLINHGHSNESLSLPLFGPAPTLRLRTPK
jgi:hypothetical protein